MSVVNAGTAQQQCAPTDAPIPTSVANIMDGLRAILSDLQGAEARITNIANSLIGPIPSETKENVRVCATTPYQLIEEIKQQLSAVDTALGRF